MKSAILTDTHFGARNDSLVFSEYFLKFYEDIFFPYIEKNHIKHIFHLGDFVDRRKFINFVVLNQCRTRVVNRIRDLGITIDILVGNHDVPYKNTNEVNAIQELFGTYDKFNIISEPIVKTYDGLDIALIPWINSGNYGSTMTFIQECTAKIAMGHLDLNGFEMDKGVIQKEGMDKEIFKGFDQVLSGHFHHKSDDGHIYYLGNEYEITWADVNDTRGFHIFDTEKKKGKNLKYIVNPYRIHELVYYDDKNEMTIDSVSKHDFEKYTSKFVNVVVTNKNNPGLFDIFIQKIVDAAPHHLNIAEDFNIDSTITDDEVETTENTVELLQKYIKGMEDADTKMDKDILFNKMHQLYVEAANMEII